MSGESEIAAVPLSDGCEVYRAVKPSWVSEGLLLPLAFIRSRRDLDGLSVSGDKSRASATFQRQRGEAALLAAQVRSLDLTLDVIADPTEGDPRHALITGLPYPYPGPYSEDAAERLRAHRYAERLLGIAAYTA
jgi:hypothetical protein